MSYVVWRVADALAKQNLTNILGNLAANVHVLAVGRIQLLTKLAKVESASNAVNKWCNSSIVQAMLIILVKSIGKSQTQQSAIPIVVQEQNRVDGVEMVHQQSNGLALCMQRVRKAQHINPRVLTSE